jgi:hypothetical protein
MRQSSDPTGQATSKSRFSFAAEDPEAVLKINAKKRGFQLEEFDFAPIVEKVKGFSPAETERSFDPSEMVRFRGQLARHHL